MKKLYNLVKKYDPIFWDDFKYFIRKYFHNKYILQNKIFFEWQYEINPYNSFRSAAMLILTFKDKFLGYLGLIPLSLNIFGKQVKKGVALCNLRIDDSCRCLGLGTQLIFEVMKRFKIIWATSYRKETGQMYTKIGGWKLMGDLNRYILILNSSKVSKLFGNKFRTIHANKNQKNSESSRIEIAEVTKFDKKVDDFWNNIAYKYPITVSRTKKYLDWRYVNHPFFKYKILMAQSNERIVGYLIYRIFDGNYIRNSFRVCHIVDMISEDNVANLLLKKLKKMMLKRRVDLIDYFSSGKFYQKVLLGLGYKMGDKQPYNKIPVNFNPVSFGKKKINFLIYYGNMKEKKEELCNKNNWYITRGDGDQDRPNPHN